MNISSKSSFRDQTFFIICINSVPTSKCSLSLAVPSPVLKQFPSVKLISKHTVGQGNREGVTSDTPTSWTQVTGIGGSSPLPGPRSAPAACYSHTGSVSRT